MEGIADLQHIYHGDANDFSADKLIAFLHSLPDDSATARALSEYNVSLSTLVAARQVDVLQAIGIGLSGKTPTEDQLLLPALSKGHAKKVNDLEKDKAMLRQRLLDRQKNK